MEIKRSENNSLYFFKAIACFCVVTLHFWLPTQAGEVFYVFSRFAVPFFFMISGYYSCFKKDEHIKYRLKKLIRLTLVCLLVYFILNILLVIVDGTLSEYLNGILNLKNILYLLFCNWTTPLIGVGHLWYMLALIYVYCIFLGISHFKLYKVFYIVSPLILLGTLLIEILTFNSYILIPEYCYRNFLFIGLPFFMIGHALHFYKSKIAIFEEKKKSVKFYGIGILLLALVIIEYKILGKDFNIYLSSILISLYFLVISINFPAKYNNKLLIYIGKNCSSDIYLWHYVLIIIFNRCLINCYVIYKMGAFLIFILSIILSVCLNYFRLNNKNIKINI